MGIYTYHKPVGTNYKTLTALFVAHKMHFNLSIRHDYLQHQIAICTELTEYLHVVKYIAIL